MRKAVVAGGVAAVVGMTPVAACAQGAAGLFADEAGLHAAMAAVAGPSRGIGLVLSAYGGKSVSLDSDLHVRLPGDTAVKYEGVSLDDKSFESPPFYGLRLSYWLESAPEVGFCVDFMHAKTIVKTSDVVERTGTIGGEAVGGEGAINETLSGFELSHGLNTLTLNLMYRWFLGEGGWRDESLLGRLQPYVGIGAGVAIPHVEVDVAPELGGSSTHEYQFAGPAAQGFVGLNYDLANWDWGGLSMFFEYKLAWAGVDADLNGGGSVRLNPWTNQFIVGLSLRF